MKHFTVFRMERNCSAMRRHQNTLFTILFAVCTSFCLKKIHFTGRYSFSDFQVDRVIYAQNHHTTY